MTKQQFDYFIALSDTDKYILNVAALMASSISPSYVAEIVQRRFKVTQKQIRECLDNALAVGIFKRDSSLYGSRNEYEVDLSFIITLYPYLNDYKSEWKSATNRFSSYYRSMEPTQIYSQLIYNLLHDEKKYKISEMEYTQFRSYNRKTVPPDISEILLLEPYEKVLPRINPSILKTQVEYLEERFNRNLDPLDTMQLRLERSIAVLPEATVSYFPNWRSKMLLQQGRLAEVEGAVSLDSNYETTFLHATSYLLDKQMEKALEYFERGMKAQRYLHKVRPLPLIPEFALFYLIALRCSEPDKSAVALNKILKFVTKKDTIGIDYVFSAVAAFCTGDKAALEVAMNIFRLYTDEFSHGLNTLMSIPVAFMIDKKPEKKQLISYQKVVRTAFDNGYKLVAFEAAYALSQWSSSEEIKQLYEEIAQTFTHRPALSNLKKQEVWEQVLNSFLSFGKTQKSTSGDAQETSKYRVLYFVDKTWTNVQPVLQTRTAKSWSKGRNIGIKTFGEGKVEGMSEQDFRIAKHVKKYDSGWGAPTYQFNDSVIKDLVSHPYLFLEGPVPIPIELLPAQPVLTVKKERDGYTLSTNLKDATNRYVIEKETNTRYHFYELVGETQQLLKRVMSQKIVVPEQGKDKLIQALGVFSARMLVQSDLMADDRSSVRTVPSDPRIRVQLLPYGSGLKAELFAKPFGDSPPYCKPGKGGANLFTNKQNEQLQTSRDLAQEKKFAALLMNEIQALEGVELSDELLTFEQPEDALELLEILAKHPDCSVVEWPEGVRFKLRATAATQQLQLRIKSKTNWFELDGELQVDESTVLSLLQLMELTATSRNRFIELKSGEFIALSKELRKQLDEIRHY